MMISGCDTCEDTCVLVSADGTKVHLRAAGRPHFDDLVGFGVEVADQGISAELGVTTWDGDGFAGFLTGLAEAFRGWEGARTWRSLDDRLTVAAEHRSRGYVALTWSLNPRDPARPNGWSARVTIVLEAGEAMRRFADHVTDFLDVDRPEPASRGGGRGWHRWLPGRGRA
jgi:hypothetical protein